MKNLYALALMCVFLFSFGCAHVTETTKTIWGSSTKALEEARVDAVTKTYYCSMNDCFNAVLALDRKNQIDDPKQENDIADVEEEEEQETKKPVSDGLFEIFIKNRAKRHIVVMGIPGNVDTTEVGIFFSQPNLTTVKLEISSLSSSAKRKVAQAVFDALDVRFSAAN